MMEDSLRFLFGFFGMLLFGAGLLFAIWYGFYVAIKVIYGKAYIKGYADGWQDSREAAKRAYEPCVKALQKADEPQKGNEDDKE